MWYFVAVVWVVMVAGIFWAYGRKRKQAVSARAKQLDALISNAKGAARPPEALQSAVVATVAPPAAAAPDRYSKKPRLLDKADALFYLLLRTGLPDHEIFAHLTLADIVEPDASMRGFERAQSVRKLSQLAVDFVICTKKLEIAAVVLYATADAAAAESRRITEAGLNAAGIRIVTIDPAALPRHQQIRALILGDDPALPA